MVIKHETIKLIVVKNISQFLCLQEAASDKTEKKRDCGSYLRTDQKHSKRQSQTASGYPDAHITGRGILL